VGDCLPGYKFTHNSDTHARYVVKNAFLGQKCNKNDIVLPFTTYTDPEIATVGLNKTAMKKSGVEFETYTKWFDRLDRATCEGRKGIYQVHCKKGTDEILGATLVGGPSGDMLCQITQAMVHKLGLGKLGDCVYPYPGYAETFMHMANYGYRPKYDKPVLPPKEEEKQ
jgi:pyruvate/2-oxoglutarate dehydrogenase complex dihydrolipoamide dehydrogenase (E3) component